MEHDIFSIEGAVALSKDVNDTCRPIFYSKPKFMKAKSEIEGRPVYEPVDYVKILVPGQRDHWEGPVKDDHKGRWPVQWQGYLAKREVVDGTPIETAGFLSPEQVAVCKHLHIVTVESLRDLPDASLPQLGIGGRKARDLAKQHLQPSDKTVQELRAKVRDLEARLDAAATPAQPEASESDTQVKRGPGRPRKE